MPKHPMLMGTNIHTLMLDTTYSTPRWAFPPQHDAVASAVEVVKAAREDSPGMLTTKLLEKLTVQPVRVLMPWVW